jgi:ribosomal protein S18 acetylase RimI-like enzyme
VIEVPRRDVMPQPRPPSGVKGMTMHLFIKPADTGDAAVISLLGRVTFAETFGHLFERHADDLRTYLDGTFGVGHIAASLGKAENTYWLALRDGLPIGYAKLKASSPPPGGNAAKPAQLQKIYLLREFLGQSLGDGLLEAVVQSAMARSDLIWLDVLQDNLRATRFYERHGFRIIGRDTYAIGAQSFLFHVMARGLS